MIMKLTFSCSSPYANDGTPSFCQSDPTSVSLSTSVPLRVWPEWPQCWPTPQGSCCCWGQKEDMSSSLKSQASESWKRETSVWIKWPAGRPSSTPIRSFMALTRVHSGITAAENTKGTNFVVYIVMNLHQLGEFCLSLTMISFKLDYI